MPAQTSSPTLFTPSMDTKTYPGKDLSLSQLIFALNEELKHTAYSPSFTLDDVLELNRDASAALATIHEWINSFVPINRVPADVFSLITTHLSSQNDRFRATFVCRHWRRTFLQHAGLWSHIYLSKGEAYMKTLLDRARGSSLTVLVSGRDPVGTVTLLHPHIRQIADLEFSKNRWADVRKFSEISSGPLPLLRTLNIDASQEIDLPDGPLFSGAVGLKELRLSLSRLPPLNYFVFPNLTSFDLSVIIAMGDSIRSSQLLDFLEASPTLRAVRMKIIGSISLEGIPQERVVVLHNIESLCLVARDGGAGYKLATHISCPSAKNTSLTYAQKQEFYSDIPPEIFPASDSLNTIIRQYTRGPIEELTFETKTNSGYFTACSLTLRSADATVVRLCFEVAGGGGDSTDPLWNKPPMYCGILTAAAKTIRDLRPLSNIKRIHICGPPDLETEWIAYTANEIGALLKSLGPLEELTISSCDMRSYFFPFLYHQRIIVLKKPVAYPPIRALTISNPLNMSGGDIGMGLVKLAKAQYELGMSFGRVTVRMNHPPVRAIEGGLKSWVGTVDCRTPYEAYLESDITWICRLNKCIGVRVVR